MMECQASVHGSGAVAYLLQLLLLLCQLRLHDHLLCLRQAISGTSCPSGEALFGHFRHASAGQAYPTLHGEDDITPASWWGYRRVDPG